MDEKLTPMVKQYLEIKKDYNDTIVFFRLGDFYEMFYEDAYIASKELEITLTSKGTKTKIPMCGVPYHSVTPYIEKLINNGHKVAIVEQIEDPKLAKGIVKRDIVRIVTPGTIIDNLDNQNQNNYVSSVSLIDDNYYLSYCDITTGEVYVLKIEKDENKLLNEILNLNTKEIVISKNFNKKIFNNVLKVNNILLSYEDNYNINYNNQLEEPYKISVNRLISYLLRTQKRSLNHLKDAEIINPNYLKFDLNTTRNLELFELNRSNSKTGTLFWLLDKCQTAMGSRMLKKWISKPLVDINEINLRYDFIDEINNNFIIKEELIKNLKTIYDLERIVGRISYGNTNPKDFLQLKNSLKNIRNIKNNLLNLNNKIDKSIKEDASFQIKDGNIIKEGYNLELDKLKKASKEGKKWLIDLENKEKERTGIKNLKIGYNRVFGYYIEVSKSNISQIKDEFNYDRKQTLSNAERYITKELKEIEDLIIGSTDKSIKLEYDLFLEIREFTFKYIKDLQKLATNISILDAILSLAIVCKEDNYTRPKYLTNQVEITNSRHPIIEKISSEPFINNDIKITADKNIILITGPNMSGKSTYMRQFALIVIMAQMGCFVPAENAYLKIFDQIFTRIGALDDLIYGKSTFMVEMIEANYALKNATKDSLILFDELGRGTATYDGMALAYSIIEYIHEKIKCITLFSTHYHELTELENKLKHLKNVHVTAKEDKDSIIFLHKVLDGKSDKSFGINVASLAKLPKSIIERSKIILNELEKKDNNLEDITIFDFNEFEEKENINDDLKKITEVEYEKLSKLNNLNLDNLTPIEALNFLYELKK